MKTAKFLDRTGWDPGPWDDEPDRAEWVDEATGVVCIALRASPESGNWCGYASVAPPHPWHGKGYDDVPEDAHSVHGGLTYSNGCAKDPNLAGGVCHDPEPGEPDDLHWFGFDCAHCWDFQPAKAAFYRKNGMDEFAKPLGTAADGDREVYRTLDYVRDQCAELAKAISEAA